MTNSGNRSFGLDSLNDRSYQFDLIEHCIFYGIFYKIFIIDAGSNLVYIYIFDEKLTFSDDEMIAKPTSWVWKIVINAKYFWIVLV